MVVYLGGSAKAGRKGFHGGYDLDVIPDPPMIPGLYSRELLVTCTSLPWPNNHCK